MSMKKKRLIRKKRLISPKSKKAGKYNVPLHFEKINWDKVEKIFLSHKSLILKHWKQEKKHNPQTRETLALLGGGAVFALSLVIPALPMALAPFIIDTHKYNYPRLNQTIKRLKKQKLVEIMEENNQTLVKITEKGKVRALRYKLEEMVVKKPARWDKKWRLVIFDIPEKYKRAREIFRQHLKAMDFYQLQKSVWVHPYPCFDEIEFLREIYGLGIDVTYIVAERIEESGFLKERYQL